MALYLLQIAGECDLTTTSGNTQISQGGVLHNSSSRFFINYYSELIVISNSSHESKSNCGV